MPNYLENDINVFELEGEISVGGGTTNYEDLENLPQINGVELKGNKTTEELGITIPTKTSDLNNDSGFVNSSIVANPYNATSTYAVGAYVTHENNLYKCNTAITTAEEWNAEHWTLVDVISAIPTKTSELDNDSNFASIDDNSTANDKAWSSEKVSEEIENAFSRTETVSGSVANFTTPVENAILKAVFGIVGTQESGTPTPSSPKAITTYNQAIITQADGNMVTQETYTIPFNANCANGELTIEDKGNGYASVKLLTVKKGYDLSTLSWQVHNQGFYYADLPSDLKRFSSTEIPDIIAEKYQAQTATWIYGHGSTAGYIAINGNKIWVTDNTTPSGMFVDYLDTPTEFDLPDIPSIITLEGENNIYTDTNGNSTITYEIGIEDKINMKADKNSVYTKAEIDKTIYRITEHGLYEQATRATLLNTDTLNVGTTNNNKKNEIIEFIGYFSSFSSVSVGHGYNITNGNYVTVDDTNLTVYKDNATVVTQVAHGLTISDFIHIIISQNDKVRVEVQIMNSTRNYTLASCVWTGCAGHVFAKVGTTMSNVVCSGVFKDFKEKIFLFGDSYVSLDDSQRYPKYLIDNGYGHLLIDGYGGRTSANALTSFNNIVAKAIPDYVVWALGMNDPDTTEVNASWLSCVQSVIDTCEEKDIELILATIPNTPTHENSYKNAWVKSSGFRYVDFAKSVGAESSGSTWYTGMLYTDNVHPTTLGAKALYTRFLTDVPEIIR